MGGKVRALLAGRYNVAYDDVAAMALPALRHRLILNFEGEAEGISTDEVLSDVLARVPRVESEVATATAPGPADDAEAAAQEAP
jgi:MoxR-like ATPase